MKIAAGSLLTHDDQINLYTELMGPAKAARQVRLARLEQKKCVCEASKVKGRWEGSDKATTRTIHKHDCPKWKKWMVKTDG